MNIIFLCFFLIFLAFPSSEFSFLIFAFHFFFLLYLTFQIRTNISPLVSELSVLRLLEPLLCAGMATQFSLEICRCTSIYCYQFAVNILLGIIHNASLLPLKLR